MPVEHINPTDSLNTGRVKLNAAIDQSNEAITKATSAETNANNAVATANQAKSTANNVQEQLNQIVIEGDSSVEAAQARVDADGNTYTTLKERLDTKEQSFSAQLAHNTNKIGILFNRADSVSVKEFGVKADGVTDDTQAFSTALNSNYNTIILPDGVIKLTNTITVNQGVPKKIIGSKNTVLSINLPSSRDLFDMSVNVTFENITFDFNNGYVKNGLLFRENLGKITVKNCTFKNVKDTDSNTSSIIVYIANKGNYVNIDGLSFENMKKKGNGEVTDGGGNLTCLYLADLVTAAPPSGFIKNIRITDVHNIDANDNIIFEDTSGIYPLSSYSGSDGSLSIENVYGYNFGKRLIKLHTSNVTIRGVYAYSDTNDALSAIGILSGSGLGNKKNIIVSDVQIYGLFSYAISTSADNVRFNNIVIDIQKPNMTGNTPYAFGFGISANQITISNAIVTAERCVLLNRTDDIIQDFKISNAVLTVPSWGVQAIHLNTGSYGFKNVTIQDVTVTNYSTSSLGSLFETATLTGEADNQKGKGLNIINCSMYGASLNNYGLFLKNIEDINITNFVYSNDGVTKAYRGIYLDSCKNVRITNMACNAFTSAAINIENNSDNIRVFGLTSANSDYSVVVTNSTNVKLKDVDKTKVILNDSISNTKTFVELDSSFGTTANRPTNPSIGHQYFDTTLGKPIWWNGSVWKDATGTTV